MELALYHPEFGYYSNKAVEVGRSGDFFTSVSVGPLFGRLLGFKFAGLIEMTLPEGPAQLIEAGAHNGQLALDLLDFFKAHRPEFFERLEYGIIEPIQSRREVQSRTLQAFAEKIRWFPALESLPERSIQGMILSNELLDAMPVRQFRWNKKQFAWQEWGVDWNHGFKWVALEKPPQEGAPNLPAELLEALPDRFVYEHSPAALEWWGNAALKLRSGFLFTADYGLEDYEFFHPSRAEGTLRSYSGHRLSSDILDDPGTRDITAHAHWTDVRAAGKKFGLRDVVFQTQAAFLVDILKEITASGDTAFSWNQDLSRQFQTLTHPEHLGRPFKILLQKRAPARGE
jgi:SAM-dependent MidA family methyltransferase